MDKAKLVALWNDAARFDPTLRIRPRRVQALIRKQVRPKPYSRATLFDAMAAGRPAVLAGVPVPVAGARRRGLQPALVEIISGAFSRRERIRVQVGPSRVRRRLDVPELMRRWSGDRALVSVTDLHIRETRLERQIDTACLSAFNLLPRGSEDMRLQEMMTLVISARGNVTDSHSDDPDGSNHCFVGRKLWLAWDTFEGRRAGLQDCERDPVHDTARFDIDAFCRLPSARWWTVEPGQTLFLPGKLTHKVVTLERYIGIGSFYVAPTSCLDSLSRWYVHGPLWSIEDRKGENAGLVDEIAMAMARRLRRLRRGRASERRQWGLDFAGPSIARWKRNWSARQRSALTTRQPFAEMLSELDGARRRPAA
jgi:hypothetical protein